MNIFVVHESPVISAQSLCNKHVVKMIVESAQILSTVIHQRGYDAPYKPTHSKHPCVLWAGSNVNNARWLMEHAIELCDEYSRRYQKLHSTVAALDRIENLWSSVFGSLGMQALHSPFVLCMPDQYKCSDAVTSYRNFYIGEKRKFAKWAPRALPPSWWPDQLA